MIFLVKILAFSLVWSFVPSNSQREKLFLFRKSFEETFLVVTWAENESEVSSGCEIFKDRELINEVLESAIDSPILTVTGNELQSLLEGCTEFILRRRRRETGEDEEQENVLLEDILNLNNPSELARTRPNGQQNRRGSTRRPQAARRRPTTNPRKMRAKTESLTRPPTTESLTTEPTTESLTKQPTRMTTVSTATLGYTGLPIIYPGTKWCGAGATAKHYGDLGGYEGVDRCCRAHDLCNDTLAPGETRYNLTNTSMLSCECDEAFYKCLSRLNTITANSIGNMYFNLLKRDCYKKEYPPSSKCKNYMTLLRITCVEYERNTTAPKVYQWIPAQRYTFIGK